MLQQTQVSRVVPKYKEFLERFPTIATLAVAPVVNVLRVWKGMGYNRRALYLKRASEEIMLKYGGKFPQKEKELIQLPSVGTYTARAILVFAYKRDIAMVDTNIRQIFTHFFFQDKPQKESVIQDIADQLVPKGKAWEWHQALMDYGALRLARARSGQARIKKSKLSVPFRQSNRFYRGRIIDILREKPYGRQEFISLCSSALEKDERFIWGIIKKLEEDGLVAIKYGVISLPF